MRRQLLLYVVYVMTFILLMMILTMKKSFIQPVPLFAKIGNAHKNTAAVPDFLRGIERPLSDRNIFFLETSGITKEDIVLNARQSCAVESAAKANPNMTVYLLFVSRSNISIYSTELFDQLQNYPNIHIRHVDLKKYMEDTPLERWYERGVWKTSQWPTSHMSDVLRYLTLWKYGGIYLDLDVVITTSLEELKNFAGAQDWEHVGAGAVGFDGSELGRRMADTCIWDVRTNFRGDVWGNNGPGVITRELQKLCSTKYIRKMTTVRCRGFKVFSPSVFYPIHYKKWKMYFESQDRNTTMERVKKARAIHVWNKLSRYEEVRVDSEVPYAIIARKYCPRIFNNCGKVF